MQTSIGVPDKNFKQTVENKKVRDLIREMNITLYTFSFVLIEISGGYGKGIAYKYSNDRWDAWGWLGDVKFKVNVYLKVKMEFMGSAHTWTPFDVKYLKYALTMVKSNVGDCY